MNVHDTQRDRIDKIEEAIHDGKSKTPDIRAMELALDIVKARCYLSIAESLASIAYHLATKVEIAVVPNQPPWNRYPDKAKERD